jgi:hypothetical protein
MALQRGPNAPFAADEDELGHDLIMISYRRRKLSSSHHKGQRIPNIGKQHPYLGHRPQLLLIEDKARSSVRYDNLIGWRSQR